MGPSLSSLLALPLFWIVWSVIATVVHALVFGFIFIMNWITHLPVVGYIINFIWGNSGNGPIPIIIIWIASGVGGFFSAQIALEKVKTWPPKASLNFIFFGFSIITFFELIVAPLIGFISEEITFLYWLDATVLGIAGIAGVRSFMK